MTTSRIARFKARFKTGLVGMVAALLLPIAAQAAEGFATANVNMRSGPSTRYPAVTVIPVGTPLEIHGCLSDTPWCDVSFYNGRGWVAGRYVQAEYRQSRVYVEPRVYGTLGIPLITFEIGNYWDRNYRNRDFYRERDFYRRDSDRNSGRYDTNRPPRRDTDIISRPPRRDDNTIGRPPRRDNDTINRPYRNEDNDFQLPLRERERDRIERRRDDNSDTRRNNDNRNDRDVRRNDNNDNDRRIRCRPGDYNCD